MNTYFINMNFFLKAAFFVPTGPTASIYVYESELTKMVLICSICQIRLMLWSRWFHLDC
jgi:hypothetical protein